METAADIPDGNLAPAKSEGTIVVMMICWLLGTGTLFPWNSMVTIVDYYTHLFPQYHPARILSCVYPPAAFATISILVYYEARVNTRLRNLAGYVLYFITALFIFVLDLATSGKGGFGTFISLCICSGVIGFADAFVAGGMIGELSFMHPMFTQSFLGGMASAGAITSALRLITRVAFENSKNGLRKGAMTFFAISALFDLICALVYAFIFPMLPSVKYYRMKAASEGSKTVLADLAAGGIQAKGGSQAEGDPKQTERLSIKELFLENIDFAWSAFFLSTLTLAIFPGFLSEDTGTHNLGSWYALVLIATYNTSDLIGRYTPLLKILNIKKRKGILIAVCSRFLLVPAFYFTAKYGDQGWMIMLTSILGLSNGHLSVCVFTSAPKGYKGPEANALGNLLTLFLQGGIFAGVMFGWLWLIGKRWMVDD